MTNLLVYELQEAQFPVTSPRPVYAPVKAQDGDLLIAPITERSHLVLQLSIDARSPVARGRQHPTMVAVKSLLTRTSSSGI